MVPEGIVAAGAVGIYGSVVCQAAVHAIRPNRTWITHNLDRKILSDEDLSAAFRNSYGFDNKNILSGTYATRFWDIMPGNTLLDVALKIKLGGLGTRFDQDDSKAVGNLLAHLIKIMPHGAIGKKLRLESAVAKAVYTMELPRDHLRFEQAEVLLRRLSRDVKALIKQALIKVLLDRRLFLLEEELSKPDPDVDAVLGLSSKLLRDLRWVANVSVEADITLAFYKYLLGKLADAASLRPATYTSMLREALHQAATADLDVESQRLLKQCPNYLQAAEVLIITDVTRALEEGDAESVKDLIADAQRKTALSQRALLELLTRLQGGSVVGNTTRVATQGLNQSPRRAKGLAGLAESSLLIAMETFNCKVLERELSRVRALQISELVEPIQAAEKMLVQLRQQQEHLRQQLTEALAPQKIPVRQDTDKVDRQLDADSGRCALAD